MLITFLYFDAMFSPKDNAQKRNHAHTNAHVHKNNGHIHVSRNCFYIHILNKHVKVYFFAHMH